MEYRRLKSSEIEILKAQNCTAEDWGNIHVTHPFNPERIRNVRFSGDIRIGVLEKVINLAGGKSVPVGLNSSSIHNCTFGNNVLINKVSLISNYDVGDDAIILNTNSIIAEGDTSFGNGVELEILNEGGGRELKIYDKLSAQIAYMIVLYRHDEKFVAAMNRMISEYAIEKKAKRGFIGHNSKITNSNILRNVWIGSAAEIKGALELEEGTIASNSGAPIFIGAGVKAKYFIVQSGSTIDSSAYLNKCFIGQGVQMCKQYSAENSAFFANCEGSHGEACSVFAGPYTVTHHKSTLLIAGLFSFYNAGSGTNQSNHMYKLGPVHQGILERGSKTGSFSYLLWPCRIGAFTAVIGKHYANFDTSEFPFSYIAEEEGKSVLTPAMNLLTVGTKRDSEKWSSRDRRNDPIKFDLINFDLLNPFTAGKILKGIKVLQELYSSASKEQELVTYRGINIRRLLLRTSSKYYDMALKIYFGKTLADKLARLSVVKSIHELKSKLEFRDEKVTGDWIDVCGLIAPSLLIEEILWKIGEGKLQEFDSIHNELKLVFDSYSDNNWGWCLNAIEEKLNLKLNDWTDKTFIQLIDEWKQNSIKLNNIIAKDAQKEFDAAAMIGFGIDGGEDVKKKDFEAVRGTYGKNKFVNQLESESKSIELKASELGNFIASLV
jgi:carbonic anhydrase/acetyltransferase-like protein (isoleucine patch superfamily)